MKTAVKHPESIERLLTPVEQALKVCIDDPAQRSVARNGLNDIAEALESAADASWLTCVRLLANLMEIVDCLADGTDDQMNDVSCAIVAFVQAALPELNETMADPTSSTESTLTRLVEQANDQWGEYLTLVGSDTFWEASALDEAIELGNTEDDGEALSGTQQVDLILSALSNGTDFPRVDDSPAAPPTGTQDESSREAADSEEGVPFAPERVELDDQLLDAYLEDVEQCLNSMERTVLGYEPGSSAVAAVQQICRDLHTLKGASASVGLGRLAAHLHGVEEWLQTTATISESQHLDPVLRCVDAVRSQVEVLKQPASSADAAPDARQDSSVPGLSPLPVAFLHDRSDEPGEESVRVKSVQLDRLMDLLVELVTWRRRRDQRVVDIDRAAGELSRCTMRLETVASNYESSRSKPSTIEREVPSDDLTKTRGYLTEITNDVREIAFTLQGARQSMADENRSVSQFLQQFRQQLVQLRRLPLSGLFQRLQRVARDAARVEHKQVRLEFIGEHAGLERSLQERLYEPLLHLVRNAVRHGIETPERRVQAGKPAEGIITLEAFGSSHLLILEIRDDGNGLDFDAIRRRGHERGLLPTDRSVSEQELTRLIFHPGFSTRNETNEIAGRGVGMDVVAAALERCNCQIDVESDRGRGTTFGLKIPLSSVIEHSIIFRAGGQLFGLPMQFVLSTSDSDAPAATEDERHVSLAEVLGVPSSPDVSSERTLCVEHRQYDLDVRGPGVRSGQLVRTHFLVDDILGTEEVVVRPLPRMLRRHPLLSGVSLSGAGEVVLLLDGDRLQQMAMTHATARANFPNATAAERRSISQRTEKRRILVADDSLSARRRLVQILLHYGFDITEVSDGVEAIDLLRTESFDAVFSDLEMPKLGGFDLLTAIKRGDRDSAEPVVIVTTRNEAETQERAQQLGADGFVAKPVTPNSIEDVLLRLDMIPQVQNEG